MRAGDAHQSLQTASHFSTAPVTPTTPVHTNINQHRQVQHWDLLLRTHPSQPGGDAVRSPGCQHNICLFAWKAPQGTDPSSAPLSSSLLLSPPPLSSSLLLSPPLSSSVRLSRLSGDSEEMIKRRSLHCALHPWNPPQSEMGSGCRWLSRALGGRGWLSGSLAARRCARSRRRHLDSSSRWRLAFANKLLAAAACLLSLCLQKRLGSVEPLC